MNNPIDTPRLRLEPLVRSHADALFEGLRDPQLYTYLDEAPPRDREWLAARYERLSSRRSPDGAEHWLNWALWSCDDHAFVGYVQATVRADAPTEIAYVLFRDAWGRGFGCEAVRSVIEHLRVCADVRAFVAHVHPDNARSIALLERLGFVRDGHAGADLRYRLDESAQPR